MTPANTDAPTPLESDFGWALRALSMAFTNDGNAAVAHLPSGARGYLVLVAVAEGQARSQLDLARRLTIDKTAMTYLLDALEEQGLVRRKPDPTDRRARSVTITPKGQRALQRARERLAVTESTVLGALAADEAAAFRSLLSRVAQGLEQRDDQDGS